jgi:hypothetical protein
MSIFSIFNTLKVRSGTAKNDKCLKNLWQGGQKGEIGRKLDYTP